MGKCLFVRKVVVKLPKNRMVYGMELTQREGIALIFVRKQKDDQSHMLITATENVQDRVFEPVAVSQFPIEGSDMEKISECLETLNSDIRDTDIDKFFRSLGDDD